MKFSSVMTPAFMVIRFLLVLALCIGNYSCSENSSKDFYIQAEKATNDGDIAKAISLYKSAIEADEWSSGLSVLFCSLHHKDGTSDDKHQYQGRAESQESRWKKQV